MVVVVVVKRRIQTALETVVVEQSGPHWAIQTAIERLAREVEAHSDCLVGAPVWVVGRARVTQRVPRFLARAVGSFRFVGGRRAAVATNCGAIGVVVVPPRVAFVPWAMTLVVVANFAIVGGFVAAVAALLAVGLARPLRARRH